MLLDARLIHLYQLSLKILDPPLGRIFLKFEGIVYGYRFPY